MPIPQFGSFLDPSANQQELIDRIAYLEKTISFHLTGGLDTANAKEFGGWYIGKDQIAAKNMMVGLSSTVTAGDDIRIWAGNAGMDAAPFRVYESGRVVATDGEFSGEITASVITGGTISGSALTGNTITGGTITGVLIRTAETGERLEFSSNQFRTYNASNNLEGLVLGPGIFGYSYGDVFLYNNGSPALVLYNTLIDGFSIYPETGYSLRIGITGRSVFARGDWVFTGNVSGIPQSGVTGLSADLSNLFSRVAALEAP